MVHGEIPTGRVNRTNRSPRRGNWNSMSQIKFIKKWDTLPVTIMPTPFHFLFTLRATLLLSRTLPLLFLLLSTFFYSSPPRRARFLLSCTPFPSFSLSLSLSQACDLNSFSSVFPRNTRQKGRRAASLSTNAEYNDCPLKTSLQGVRCNIKIIEQPNCRLCTFLRIL